MISKRPIAAALPPILSLVALAAAASETSADKRALADSRDTTRSKAPAAATLFERDVLPILTAHCLKCHGLEARKAGLDLRSVGLMRVGGENGTVIVEGDAKKSTLFKRISDRSMPPEGELPLSDEHITLIESWINGGARTEAGDTPLSESNALLVTDRDREYWAFRTPVRTPVPPVQHADQVRSPVDAFVLSRLEAKSLQFSPVADRHTLVRRLYLDLLGLPPTPEDVAAYLRDDSPDAYVQLVERLLASQNFGERWGRHWLDAAGYADTIGDDTDAAITKLAAGKWRFRDYVIRAFNEDKPFDRFLIEQFAGDELFDWRTADSFTAEQQERLIATGFLRMAPDETLQNELNTADIRHAVLQKTMEVSLNCVTGLTLTCARCHSHKFDPIPQEDYYRLLSIFTPAYNPQLWLQPGERELPDVAPGEKKRIDESNARIDSEIGQCKTQLAAIREPYRKRRFEEKLATLPEADRGPARAAFETPPDKRSERQKALVAKHEHALKVSDEELTAAMSEEDRSKAAALTQSISELSSQRRSWGTIQAVYDVGRPPATHLLRRGNHQRPADEVTPGFLRVLCRSESEAALDVTPHVDGTSGRRLALAHWLTDASAPSGGLVSRVFVNRVWQQLFGRGLVATSENFGASGTPPTHPELLDWLSVEFTENGWRIKPLLKLLLVSNVYRQASSYGPAGKDAAAEETIARAFEIDPDNELLWRMRLRPLEAEVVRDSILAVSGKLDKTPGGPPVMHEPASSGLVKIKKESLPTPTSQYRRSVYLLCRRRYHLSLMETFDQPEVAGACLRRTHAPVVSQSLTMLNDPFLTEQSRAFAERVRRETPDGSRRDRIDRSFRLALGRPADPSELVWSEELLDRQQRRYREQSANDEEAAQRALEHLCLMLFNTSEFLYIR